jgi:hypothetical protein
MIELKTDENSSGLVDFHIPFEKLTESSQETRIEISILLTVRSKRAIDCAVKNPTTERKT